MVGIPQFACMTDLKPTAGFPLPDFGYVYGLIVFVHALPLYQGRGGMHTTVTKGRLLGLVILISDPLPLLKCNFNVFANNVKYFAVRAQSSMPTSSEVAAIFAEHSLDETMERARAKTESIVDTLLNRQLLQAEENVLLESRRSAYGSRQQSRIATGKSSIRYRGYASSATSKNPLSSK